MCEGKSDTESEKAGREREYNLQDRTKARKTEDQERKGRRGVGDVILGRGSRSWGGIESQQL